MRVLTFVHCSRTRSGPIWTLDRISVARFGWKGMMLRGEVRLPQSGDQLWGATSPMAQMGSVGVGQESQRRDWRKRRSWSQSEVRVLEAGSVMSMDWMWILSGSCREAFENCVGGDNTCSWMVSLTYKCEAFVAMSQGLPRRTLYEAWLS